jgi:hypothetical protein
MRRWLNVVAYLALSLALLAGVYRVETTTRATHSALCAFKVDLERRVQAGEEFLAENPEGVPGISRESIQRSLDSQKSTLLALASLDC